jgi:hypothetical protein
MKLWPRTALTGSAWCLADMSAQTSPRVRTGANGRGTARDPRVDPGMGPTLAPKRRPEAAPGSSAGAQPAAQPWVLTGVETEDARDSTGRASLSVSA